MIVRKVLVFIAVSTFSFMLLVATAFASPQLSDADISFSVKGYYSQYMFRTTYTASYTISSTTGQPVSASSTNKLSDYVSLTPGGGFFVYNTSADAPSAIISICFYDADYNVVSGGYDSGSTQFFDVPSNASYCRYSVNSSSTVSGVNATRQPVVTPTGGLTLLNYHYIWSEFNSISIDEDGFVTIPYQVNAYTFFLLDFRFFDSTFQFSNIAFDVQTTYTGGYFTGSRLLTYGSGGLQVDTYYIDDDGVTHLDGSVGYTATDNPFHFYGQVPFDRFSGFRLYFDTGGSVSTSMKVHLYNFELDGEDVAVQLAANDAIDELENIGNQLELATPDVSQIYNNLNNIIVNLDDGNFGSFDWFGPSDGIFITMCVTSFTFAALAYILFGKRG